MASEFNKTEESTRPEHIKNASCILGRIPDVPQEAWDNLFETGDIRFENFKYTALLKGLAKDGLRSLFWKIFLNYIPVDNSFWADVLAPKRAAYDEFIDKLKGIPDAGDPLGVAPVDNSEGWGDFFGDKELTQTIQLDLSRTYPEEPFFEHEDIQNKMLNILLVYSKQNSDFGYRQGMNELLAPLIMVNCVCAHACMTNFPETHPLRVANDYQYIEADTYWLFVEMMKHMSQYFYHAGSGEHPCIKKSKFIQNNLLRRVDPKLSSYLRELQIEPQLYGLRWYRLFFTREFHIRDCCHLWDCIFAEYQNSGTNDFLIVDYICCAMLVYMRSRVMGKEYHVVLKTLLKYPPVEDPWVLVQSAQNLRQKIPHNPNVPSKLPRPTKALKVVRETKKKPTLLDKALKKVGDAVDDVSRSFTGKPTRKAEHEEYKGAYERLVNMQDALGKKCGLMVDGLSKIEFEPSGESESAQEFYTIIAELKLLRDSLAGSLDAETVQKWLAESGCPVAKTEEEVVTN